MQQMFCYSTMRYKVVNYMSNAVKLLVYRRL